MTIDEDGVEVVVRGEAARKVAPTRATVTVTVHAVDPAAATAATRAAEVLRSVRSEIEGLAATTRGAWSIGNVTTYLDRPWVDGGRAPAEHHAVATVSLELLDVRLVGPVVDAWSARADLDLGGVAWDIGPEERARAERDARAEAVAVAARRARDLGEAIGRSTIRLRRLVDLDSAVGALPWAFATKAESVGGLGSALVPADVVVAVALEAHVTAH